MGAVQVVVPPWVVEVGEKLPPVAVQVMVSFKAPETVACTAAG